MSAQRPPRSPRPSSASPRRELARRQAIARRRRAVTLFGVAILAFIGLMVAHRVHPAAHADGATTPTPRRPKSFGVGIITCRFVDHSRATPDFANATSTPGRVLLTEIRYPTLVRSSLAEDPGAAIARRWGPYPLVVFAHGYKLTPDTYAQLLDAWVRSGIVVAAPIFPDTNTAAVGADDNSSLNENDDINQPGDVAFVTRQLATDSTTISSICPRIYHVLQASDVGVAGQSDGAQTVAALEYDRHYEVPGLAVRATAVLSGQEFATPTGASDPYADAHGPPLLVVQSRTDECNPPQNSTALYNDITQNDKWFLALSDADHLPPYVGGDPSAFALVSSVTTRFFDIELGVPGVGKSLSVLGNAQPIVGKLTTGARAPVIAALNQVPAACYLGSTP